VNSALHHDVRETERVRIAADFATVHDAPDATLSQRDLRIEGVVRSDSYKEAGNPMFRR
jgi:hypothetical protein